MKHNAIFWMAGIFNLLLLPSTLAAQYQPQDFRTGKKMVKSILILPPEASVMKSGMKGAEPLVAEAQTLGSDLTPIVGKVLSEKGCNILQDPFSSDSLDRNPDLKYALSNLQSRYDKLQVLLLKKPKDVKTGRFSLGDEVANFSPGAAADGLVFVRAKGFVPTTGLKTFVVLTGMGITYSHVSLDISVVDAQTGTMLYFAKPSFNGNFVGKPDAMTASIVKSFYYFRLQGSPKN
jgi:hypothetical protein